jgi:hypothetical protein
MMVAKRVSLADLADEDILISGDSLKSWIEACGLTPQDVVEQLKSWLNELDAIPVRSVQPDTPLARSMNKVVAGTPHIQAYLKRTLSAADFTDIDSEVRTRCAIAETRCKANDSWQADAEKRWHEAALARLAEINEHGARSAWDSDENLYMRRGALPAAFVS